MQGNRDVASARRTAVSIGPKEAGMNSRASRRAFLHLAAGAGALPAVSRGAWAQAYPSRPVRLIIGYTPGGSADITARLTGQWLSERLGQSVVVESRPGGGTNIAPQAGVRPAAGAA